MISGWLMMDSGPQRPYLEDGFGNFYAPVGLIIVSFTGFE